MTYCFSWDPSVIQWGDVSGWLQAIFSVVAIWAAILISRNDKKDARIDELLRIRALVTSCANHISEASNAYRNPGLSKLSNSQVLPRLQRLETMVKEVDLYQLPAGKVDEFLDLLEAIGSTIQLYGGCPNISSSQYTESPERITQVTKEFAHYEKKARTLSESINSVILRRLDGP